jgi:hypothetical protein
MAAFLAAGLATSMADNVYSVNVVGYINLELTNGGWNLVANQLDLDGTGTNNTLATVFGDALPSGTTVAKFVGGGWNQSDSYLTGIGWLAGGTLSANPGEGLMINCGSAAPGTTTVTVVGNVLEGSLSNPYDSGSSVESSQVPQAGLVSTDLGFPVVDCQLVFWDKVAQGYPTSAAYVTPIGWLPSEPTIAVGQAFFVQGTTGGTWTRNFTVPRP